MKVTSKKSVHFPSLDWGISAGESRELPEDKDAQALILAHPAVEQAGGSRGKQSTPKDE